MKNTFTTVMLAGLIYWAMSFAGQAAAQYGPHHPGEGPATPCVSKPGMMMQQAAPTACARPCTPPMGPSPMPCDTMGNRHLHRHGMADDQGMMSCGRRMMSGGCDMMNMPGGFAQRGLHHMLFLDRAEDLELTSDQIAKLKAIHSDCRKEHIRKGAEIKVARLELEDLLGQPTWIPAAAEKLIRKIHTLEGDLQLRRLQARAAARAVLTPEQLKKAAENADGDDPSDLFR